VRERGGGHKSSEKVKVRERERRGEMVGEDRGREGYKGRVREGGESELEKRERESLGGRERSRERKREGRGYRVRGREGYMKE
jgi:hypothetical protein